MLSGHGITIVGGGLAGLTAAHTLKSVGLEAHVYETDQALGGIGAAVNVSPQAVKALDANGVGDQILAVGTQSPGIYSRNMQSGEFLEFNDRIAVAERFGAPFLPITVRTSWTRSPQALTLPPSTWATALSVSRNNQRVLNSVLPTVGGTPADLISFDAIADQSIFRFNSEIIFFHCRDSSTNRAAN